MASSSISNQPAQPVPVEQDVVAEQAAFELWRWGTPASNGGTAYAFAAGAEYERHRLASTPAPHGDDRLRQALELAVDAADRAVPFISSRQQMHPAGVEWFEQDIAHARAALSSAPPVGAEMVLVPRVPTEAMLEAAADATVDEDDAREVWSAMIAASQPDTHPISRMDVTEPGDDSRGEG